MRLGAEGGTVVLRELDSRTSSGMTVSLGWDSEAPNVVVIKLADASTNTHASFVVPGERAKDAFDHPYMYLDRKG